MQKIAYLWKLQENSKTSNNFISANFYPKLFGISAFESYESIFFIFKIDEHLRALREHLRALDEST